MLTTNATTVEEARIRGVRMTEALLLRTNARLGDRVAELDLR